MRKFELTETYVGNADVTLTVCFMQFLTTVRGKLCWNVVFRDDVVGVEQAKIFVKCVEEVLNEIDLE